MQSAGFTTTDNALVNFISGIKSERSISDRYNLLFFRLSTPTPVLLSFFFSIVDERLLLI